MSHEWSNHQPVLVVCFILLFTLGNIFHSASSHLPEISRATGKRERIHFIASKTRPRNHLTGFYFPGQNRERSANSPDVIMQAEFVQSSVNRSELTIRARGELHICASGLFFFFFYTIAAAVISCQLEESYFPVFQSLKAKHVKHVLFSRWSLGTGL